MLGQYRFDRLNTEHGLSQSTVYRIYQDRRGFLWFASYDGLNRYDGYNFTVFRHTSEDTTSMSSGDATALFEDSKGRFWVGTRTAGLNLFDSNTGKFTHFKTALDGADVSALSIADILEDKAGNIWIFANARGIFRYDVNKKQLVKFKDISPKYASASAAIRDSKGRIWFGSSRGELTLFANQKTKTYTFSGVNPTKNSIRFLLEDTPGNILIATQGNGLFRFKAATRTFEQVIYNPAEKDGENIVTGITKDHQHNLWLSTDGGAFLFPNGDFTKKIHFKSNKDSEEGLSTHAILNVFADKDNNIWMGTWEGGINVHYSQPRKFGLYQRLTLLKNTLPDSRITCVNADFQQNIWVGTSKGLTKIEPRSNNFIDFRTKTSGNDINNMLTDQDGNLWMGIWGKGIDYIAKGTNKVITINDELLGLKRGNNVTALGKSEGENIWVGTTFGGPFLLDKKTLQLKEVLNADHEMPVPVHINCFREEADGNLWAGSFSGGVYRFNTKTRKVEWFNQRNGSLSDDHITTIFQDHQGRILCGTNGGGLNIFDPKKRIFKSISTKDGLPSNAVKGILEDQHHNLWVSTNEGISKFNLEDKPLKFRNYTVAEGLQGREFTGACYQNSVGEMYFGGANGLNFFHPDSLEDNLLTPQVYLSGFKLFNKSVTVGAEDSPLTQDITNTKHLTLKYNQSVFSFDYLALDYQPLKNNQYAYKMDGFDKDWNYVGTQRTATYTNLNEGDYVFWVKATNNDGVWTDRPASLHLHILPPWYRTWWAYLLYGFIILAGIFILRRIIQIREGYRTNLKLKELENHQIHELDRLKTDFFTNISHEFRTPLTLIISPLEKFITENPLLSPKQQTQLGAVRVNAQKLLRLINELLDLAKLESGRLTPSIARNELIDYVERITTSFQSHADQHRVSLEFKPSIPSLWAWFDADIVEKVITNLLSNAFRFTPAGGKITLEIGLKNEDKWVEISVKDTGLGIPEKHLSQIFNRFYQVPDKQQPRTVGTGVGLALCKELMDLHKGKIWVESTPNEGSTFFIDFPIVAENYEKSWLAESPIAEENATPHLEKILFSASTKEKNKHKKEVPMLLIVEDNDELREYIREIFEMNFEVLDAPNGKKGVELAKKYLPDLIISDWMMPEMNGIELCEAIKNHEATSHIPVVLLTSKSSQESRIEGLQTGADEYVTKPFNANLLEIRVQNLLANRQKLRERFSRELLLKPQDISLTSADEVFLQKAIAAIEAQLGNADFDVEDLENALNLSKMQLYRKLKSLTNLAGNEFIRNIRLKRAAQLLQSQQFNISEIAYKTGFNDPAYFTKMFKKEFGKAPSEFV